MVILLLDYQFKIESQVMTGIKCGNVYDWWMSIRCRNLYFITSHQSYKSRRLLVVTFLVSRSQNVWNIDSALLYGFIVMSLDQLVSHSTYASLRRWSVCTYLSLAHVEVFQLERTWFASTILNLSKEIYFQIFSEFASVINLGSRTVPMF